MPVAYASHMNIENSFMPRSRYSLIVPGDIVFFVFDVPFLEDYEIRKLPLRDRRRLLETWLKGQSHRPVRLSDTFDAEPPSIRSSAGTRAPGDYRDSPAAIQVTAWLECTKQAANRPYLEDASRSMGSE